MKYLPLILLLWVFPVFAQDATEAPKIYEEMVFLKTFAGQTAEFVEQELGKPDSIAHKENEGGVVEFWIYHDRVKQHKSDKTYRITQVGIVNDYVETLGHSNRLPEAK